MALLNLGIINFIQRKNQCCKPDDQYSDKSYLNTSNLHVEICSKMVLGGHQIKAFFNRAPLVVPFIIGSHLPI